MYMKVCNISYDFSVFLYRKNIKFQGNIDIDINKEECYKTLEKKKKKTWLVHIVFSQSGRYLDMLGKTTDSLRALNVSFSGSFQN